MSITEVQAIDVHAHFGLWRGTGSELVDELMTATPEEVVRRAQLSRIRYSVASPSGAFMPLDSYNPVTANVEAHRVAQEVAGMLQWVVVDPNYPETFRQAEEMLPQPWCMGMKIHPELHKYEIRELGPQLFGFAARTNAVIISHSGEKTSMPEDFLTLANDFPQVNVIVAHLGCGWDRDLSHQVRAIKQSKHGNLYTDTSSAASLTANLIEWAVGQIGAEHILFGTDTPLYFAPMQRARIDYAGISDADKRLILCGNAERILKIPQP